MTAITVVERDPKKDFFAHAPARPHCPFYGFVGMGGMLLDNRGNGCGIAGGHRPCAMQIAHETPSWNECKRFNHDANCKKIEQIFDTCKVFPEELLPKNVRTWGGITLREWFDIMRM